MTSKEVGNSITCNINSDKEDSVLINIKELIKTEEWNDEAVYVYRVPKSVSSPKPEAFTPQFVGLGPYHHSSPKVYAIEKLKVTKAKKKLNDFSNYTENLKKSNFAHTIRYCYDSSLALKDDTMLYLMTVDALFLHDLLNCSLEGKNHPAVFAVMLLKQDISKLIEKRGMPLVNAAGVELTTDAVIRDVFMLENQIPTCILKRIITEIPTKSTEIHINVDEQLNLAMLYFCTMLCPFDTKKSKPVNPVHLLDHMYSLIAPDPEPDPKPEPDTSTDPGFCESFLMFLSCILMCIPVILYIRSKPDSHRKPELKSESKPERETELKSESKPGSELKSESKPEPELKSESKPEPEPETDLNICEKIYLYLLFVIVAPIFLTAYSVSVIPKLISWVFSSLFGLLVNCVSFCYPAAENLHSALSNNDLPFLKPFTNCVRHARDTLKYIEQSTKQDMDTGRGVTIPSVKELHNAGIHFQPADGGISSIKFVDKECKIYLPIIRLDVNSEVIMRNLVAYESLIKSEYLIFTRYTELMRAIINTAEDVELLVDENIIQTDKLSHEVVAQLFSGMSKSIKPTETPELDKEIQKVKDKFDSTHKLSRVITKYVYSSGKFFTVLAALVFLLLTGVQTYCSIFGCYRSSKSGYVPEYRDYGRNNHFVNSM